MPVKDRVPLLGGALLSTDEGFANVMHQLNEDELGEIFDDFLAWKQTQNNTDAWSDMPQDPHCCSCGEAWKEPYDRDSWSAPLRCDYYNDYREQCSCALHPKCYHENVGKCKHHTTSSSSLSSSSSSAGQVDGKGSHVQVGKPNEILRVMVNASEPPSGLSAFHPRTATPAFTDMKEPSFEH